MRKLAGFFALITCLLVYIVSSVQSYTINFSSYKNSPGALIKSDKYTYGDLYGLSYLSAFKKKLAILPIPAQQANYRPVNLYAVCDSYLWSFIDSAKYYYGVNQLQLIKTNNYEQLTANPDTTKINVLLLEFSERNVISVLHDSVYVKKLIGSSSNTPGAMGAAKPVSAVRKLSSFKQEAVATLFNKKINTNIESNIWDISCFSKLRKIRADINYKLFKTLNKDVFMSTNGNQLYYGPTIDTTTSASSFRHLSKNDLNTVINSLNFIYEKAKKMKFDSIYVAIIPNPVSVLDPHYNGLHYNNLVARLQASPRLKARCINILPEFTQQKNKVYFTSDSHWNFYGANIWLQKYNAELVKLVKQHQPVADN